MYWISSRIELPSGLKVTTWQSMAPIGLAIVNERLTTPLALVGLLRKPNIPQLHRRWHFRALTRKLGSGDSGNVYLYKTVSLFPMFIRHIGPHLVDRLAQRQSKPFTDCSILTPYE